MKTIEEMREDSPRHTVLSDFKAVLKYGLIVCMCVGGAWLLLQLAVVVAGPLVPLVGPLIGFIFFVLIALSAVFGSHGAYKDWTPTRTEIELNSIARSVDEIKKKL